MERTSEKLILLNKDQVATSLLILIKMVRRVLRWGEL